MAKKNVRLIPPLIRAKLREFGKASIVAGCSRTFSAEALTRGALVHLGVTLSGGTLSYPKSVLPSEDGGKYSDRNVNGEEIVRRDLPIETHYRSVETPNWGDSYYGTHTVDLPYQKYPRDFIAPDMTEIEISVIDDRKGRNEYVFVFRVARVLDPKSRRFEDDLLEDLNLLQENVGSCGVQKSDATVSDYVKTLRVSWEVLPPGTREEAVERVFRGKTPSPEERAAVEDRYDFLRSLKPEKLVYGTSGLQRYFGGLIRDDLVVFENIEYGNAIYIMFENWQDLSKRTRTELLSGRFGNNFERVMHASGWKGTVRKIIKQRLGAK